MVDYVAQELNHAGLTAKVLDLREIEMEFCDARPLKEYSQDLQNAYNEMEQVSAFVFGMPVYCFSVSGPLKNFIDITSGALEKKAAGILCNAGGNRSYLASGDLSKILAYESHVTTIQPVVYSSYEDFEDRKLTGEKVKSNAREMVENLTDYLKNKL